MEAWEGEDRSGPWSWAEGAEAAFEKGAEFFPEAARPRRVLEPWEEEREAYPGAMAMADLPLLEGDPEGTQRVIARALTLRVVVLAEVGDLPDAEMLAERLDAQEYVKAIGPPSDPERRALGLTIRLARLRSGTELADALMESGAHAAARGHALGAFAMYRAAYFVGLGRGWVKQTAQAAQAILALAMEGEGKVSVRLWRRRVKALTRRAALLEQEAREARLPILPDPTGTWQATAN